jgi:hypothetical protein
LILRRITPWRSALSAALLVLSRYRDKTNYVDVPVMPMLVGVGALRRSVLAGSSA